MKKIILACILFIGYSAVGFSQSKNIKENAKGIVKKLNDEIVSVDKSAALTEDQQTALYNIHLKRLEALKDARDSGAPKEKMKAINKKYYQQIYQTVLTKEQKKAKRILKEKENQ